MHLTQGLHRSMATNPDGLATIFEGRRHTYSTLGERVARLAGGLKRLGLKDGDRVGLLAYNSDYYLEVLFATPWAGGVIVPMNWRLTPTEVRYLLEDAGITIMIV